MITGGVHQVRAGAFRAGPDAGPPRNPIHTDTGAREHGFERELVAGVDLFAYVATAAVGRWGRGWLERGTLDVRFRRPVYAGEEVAVRLGPPETDEEGDRLGLAVGTDREERCAVGSVGLPRTAPPPPDPLAYPDAEPPPVLPPADPESLHPGPLGAVGTAVDAATARWYLATVAEPDPLYLRERVVHPGLLLREVNDLLASNVTLGPWIHLASRCRFAGPAYQDEPIITRGHVLREYHRSGRGYVELGALVLAGAEERPVLEVEHLVIYRI